MRIVMLTPARRVTIGTEHNGEIPVLKRGRGAGGAAGSLPRGGKPKARVPGQKDRGGSRKREREREKRYRIIVLRRLAAGARCSWPLRKFLQTKIYTDAAAEPPCIPPCCSRYVPFSFAFLVRRRRAWETAPSKREVASPSPTLIFLVSIKMRPLLAGISSRRERTRGKDFSPRAA